MIWNDLLCSDRFLRFFPTLSFHSALLGSQWPQQPRQPRRLEIGLPSEQQISCRLQTSAKIDVENVSNNPGGCYFFLSILSSMNNHFHRFQVTIRIIPRGKKILEQLSRTSFFTRFENPALFFPATWQRKKGREFKKNRVLEIYSNIFFTLEALLTKRGIFMLGL